MAGKPKDTPEESNRKRTLQRSIHVILKPFFEALEDAVFTVFEGKGEVIRIHKAATRLHRRATEVIYTRDVLDEKRKVEKQPPRRPLQKVR